MTNDIRAAFYENVRLGRMEVFLDDDGVERFRMTDEGKRVVQDDMKDEQSAPRREDTVPEERTGGSSC